MSQRKMQKSLKQNQLTKRWYALREHAERDRFFHSAKRFNTCHSGRRSGKTEKGKRRLIIKALSFTDFSDGLFVAGAPTHMQAKRIFWRDLKLMVPERFRARRPSESELRIELVTGTTIQVVGLDKPERIEGVPIDHMLITEMGNIKKAAWEEHLRPALSNIGRPGSADLEGVPEGRNHFYDLCENAKSNDPKWDEWDNFQWESAEILDAKEIAEAMATMDERTFDQEYRGSFIDFAGRAYYAFDSGVHAAEQVAYDPKLDLVFCFDFNVAPGVAVACQEQIYGGARPDIEKGKTITVAVGEVYIPKDSNTPAVCLKLREQWKAHQRMIFCYGDATGGASGTAQTRGSDWDLIRAYLRDQFGNRVKFRYPRANPRQKARLNAVNSRMRTIDNKVHFLTDRKCCPRLVRDLEGVQIKIGTAGEIEKKQDEDLTHISDAFGYYIAEKFPVAGGASVMQREIIA